MFHHGYMMFRFKQIAGILIDTAIFAVLLFAPAGTLRWPRAWVFLSVVFVAATLSVFAIPEDLLNERYGAPVQKGQPLADKFLVTALVMSFCATVALIPLDVFHYHFMRSPGKIASWVGLILFMAGWWILAYALVENKFAAPVVKFQKERRQHVVDSGPYRVVRHPMYSAVIPLMVGMALWLGSCAAALAAIVPIALAAVRALFEEKFLRSELPGYEEYMQRTRFRLIPLVW